MTKELRWTIFVIVILNLVCAYIFLPIPDKPLGAKLPKLTLGIDLAGGAEIQYRCRDISAPDTPVTRAIAQETADRIRARIDRGGLKEPKINVRGDDIIQIQVAGIDKTMWERYKNLVGTMGRLEIKEVAKRDVHETAKTNNWVVGSQYEVLPNPDKEGPHGEFEKMVVLREPIIEGKHLQSAIEQADPENPGKWKIEFTLKSGEGPRRFEAATRRLSKGENKGALAIILDGKVISAPKVQSTIRDRGQITGGFDQTSARDLANVLSTGSLPVAIGRVNPATGGFETGKPESEALVGPSLGQDAIRRGIIAVSLAFAFVALFMVVYYRASGIVAVLALAMNVLFLMTAMSFLGATLTLPGVAGIALTIGMAVDANILINERIREELGKGKTAFQAFEHGHERALTAIVDGNVTTLLAAAVLYFMGTGPIRGFAVTLSVGILSTLFSVLFCGKNILKALLYTGTIKQFKMMKLFENPNYNFMGKARIAMLGSLVIIVGCFAVFYASGLLHTGTAGHVAFEDIEAGALQGADTKVMDKDAGGGIMVVFQKEGFRPRESLEQVKSIVGEFVSKDGNGKPYLSVRHAQPLDDGSPRLLVTLTKDDLAKRDAIKQKLEDNRMKLGLSSRGFTLLTVPHNAPPLGFDFRGGTVISFQLDREEDIGAVREKIFALKGEDGLPKYSDGEVQIINTEATKLADVAKLNVTRSRQFQLRTGHQDPEEIKKDLEQAFTGMMGRDPFEVLSTLDPADPKTIYDREAGGGLMVYLRPSADVNAAVEKIKGAVAEFVSKSEDGKPYVDVRKLDPVGGLPRVKILLTKDDLIAKEARERITSKLDDMKMDIGLSSSPFLTISNIGPAVAEELKNSTIWALIWSWVLIIIYIWIRFYSVKFGAAAVVALIHDAIVSLGVVVLLGMVIPKALGLSFDLTLSTVAAMLTIVGYSVNDTIVLFDRVRENIFLMKRHSLAEIMNASVNQTLSRTIWTSFTTWISAVCLYVVTMTASGGVSGLALPLIIGVIVGTYSSIYVASALVLTWYKGQRPAFDKK